MKKWFFVGGEGLGPPASAMSMPRDNQLRQPPINMLKLAQYIVSAFQVETAVF